MLLDTLLAFDPVVLAAFIGAGLLLNLTPGSDFLYVSSSGITGGPRIGMAAAVGINIGITVHVLAAAAGVSAILLAYPAAYQAIKLLGAGYLLFLAWSAWTARDLPTKGRAAPTAWHALKRGALLNILNPKTALFIFAFIPQFTDPAVGPFWVQILILGTIFLLNGFLFSLALGALAGALADPLRAHLRAFNKLTAILFGGLAARLILD
ncbi:LysE family translocator [Sedimentitalea arenosa]|uniref:LysE family translocator n=1 Tax=Sedimentitalea arenosa TaxID=2798803 RepID=A0A8J7JIQ9_9RHOB|nr:LysE family translocator [Arenibacterium arenosum]MBJ6372859.1 LysE family translocator [Arenibacterium arenosum]